MAGREIFAKNDIGDATKYAEYVSSTLKNYRKLHEAYELAPNWVNLVHLGAFFNECDKKLQGYAGDLRKRKASPNQPKPQRASKQVSGEIAEDSAVEIRTSLNC